MSKRSYASVSVNRVRAEAVEKSLGGRPVIIGVDVAKERQYASLWALEAPGRAERLQGVHFGLAQTREFIELVGALGASAVTVVVEPTGSYSVPLVHAFQQSGWDVVEISGKKTHDAREIFDGVPSSHDAKACDLLVQLYLLGQGKSLSPKSDEARDRTAAVYMLRRYQDQLSRLRGELEGLLAKFWPEVTKCLSLTNASLPALLSAFPGPAAVRARPKEARRHLRKVGRSFLAGERIDEVLWSAESTLGVPMTAGEREALKALAEEICELRARLAKAKAKVEAIGETAAPTLVTFAGKATTAILMSELGPLHEYSNARALEKAIGLNLRQNSSGTKIGRVTISKRGSSMARQSLHFVALRTIKSDAVVRAYYEAKRARDGGASQRAIVAIMRKIARALWHLAQGQAFDAAKLFDVRKLRALERDRRMA